MKAKRKPVNEQTIYSTTGWNQCYFAKAKERVDNVMNDPEKKKRIEKQECSYCYYMKQKVGGAAVTFLQCGLCENQLTSGSICVDVLCLDCAKEQRLCKHCGGDIEMKHRRKPRNLE